MLKRGQTTTIIVQTTPVTTETVKTTGSTTVCILSPFTQFLAKPSASANHHYHYDHVPSNIHRNIDRLNQVHDPNHLDLYHDPRLDQHSTVDADHFRS